MVLSAREEDTAHSGAAPETLCQTYWYPLYAYVRGQGHRPPDAQDLTQEFFARLLQKDFLQRVAREKGKFRELFREEVAHTVAGPEDIEEEIRHLLGALGD